MNFKIMLWFNSRVSHYHHDKYWKMKFKLLNNNTNKLVRYLYLYKMKKMEARNCASLGTRVNGGSCFEEAPFFTHGIKGIFISDYVHLGKM